MMPLVIGNPWQKMREDTARRADFSTTYNFFWIRDDQGRFGLMIELLEAIPDDSLVGSMKGISIAVNQINSKNFYLILHDSKDWEIFLAICNDIIEKASKGQNELQMITIVNQRIRRWQKFLYEDMTLILPEKVQMGLFSELICLRDIVIPAIGYKDALLSWVGPNSDQKDFSLAEMFIEVKSFVSSRGPKVKISSISQLDDDIKPIFLQIYALSQSSSGLNIVELVLEIHKLIPARDLQSLILFESQLEAYGFIIDITRPPFSSYQIDLQRSYEVKNNFPRITGGEINTNISNVNYTIDLSRCEKYETVIPIIKTYG